MIFRLARLGGIALLAVAMTAGCSKSGPAPAGGPAASDQHVPASGDVAARDGSVAADSSPTVIAVPENGDMNAVLGQLSMALRKYVFRTRTAPKNFEEFAANAHLQFPPPPDGQRYAIEHGAVVLEKR
jgi:hypothetical protein